MNLVSLGLLVLGLLILTSSSVVVIDAGQVGVRHAFGKVDPLPLYSGVRFVPPWSSVEKYSTREEQWPTERQGAETMDALSNEPDEHEGGRGGAWQIDPAQSPKIFVELGTEEQIKNVVVNAIRKGVRDGMVQFSINDISKRNAIASAMEFQVDSALLTRPRQGHPSDRQDHGVLSPEPGAAGAGGGRDQQQDRRGPADRDRETQGRSGPAPVRPAAFLNQTLTPEALMKQYLEVLHDMRSSNNLVVLVPTEGGVPMLDLAALRKNLAKP